MQFDKLIEEYKNVTIDPIIFVVQEFRNDLQTQYPEYAKTIVQEERITYNEYLFDFQLDTDFVLQLYINISPHIMNIRPVYQGNIAKRKDVSIKRAIYTICYLASSFLPGIDSFTKNTKSAIWRRCLEELTT